MDEHRRDLFIWMMVTDDLFYQRATESVVAPKGFHLLYLVHLVVDDVGNGGMLQLLFNNRHKIAVLQQALHALQRLEEECPLQVEEEVFVRKQVQVQTLSEDTVSVLLWPSAALREAITFLESATLPSDAQSRREVYLEFSNQFDSERLFYLGGVVQGWSIAINAKLQIYVDTHAEEFEYN
jgi:hypothetical protein